ncbi:hypothetical protein [Niveibacterium terrae]|uniref:hypothetical protein n=1 Tax=Niveibacterium terrae TaxID=3373598 RepID=UPI003A8F2664
MSTEKLVIAARLNIPNGPELSLDTEIPVSGYGKFCALIAAGAVDFALPLPWAQSLAPQFLAIKATRQGLSYKLNDAASTETYLVDGPHLLFGSGALGLLGAHPVTLYFTNGGTTDIAVEVLIGG